MKGSLTGGTDVVRASERSSASGTQPSPRPVPVQARRRTAAPMRPRCRTRGQVRPAGRRDPTARASSAPAKRPLNVSSLALLSPMARASRSRHRLPSGTSPFEDLRSTPLDVVAADAPVRGQCQGQPATQCVAGDGSDRRFGDGRDRRLPLAAQTCSRDEPLPSASRVRSSGRSSPAEKISWPPKTMMAAASGCARPTRRRSQRSPGTSAWSCVFVGGRDSSSVPMPSLTCALTNSFTRKSPRSLRSCPAKPCYSRLAPGCCAPRCNASLLKNSISQLPVVLISRQMGLDR